MRIWVLLLLLATRAFAEWELSVEDVKKLSRDGKQPATRQGTRPGTRPLKRAAPPSDLDGLSLPPEKKRPAVAPTPSQTVDLSSPSSTSVDLSKPSSASSSVDLSRPSSASSSGETRGTFGRPSFGNPNFKIIFDLLLTYWPSYQPLTFQNYHSLLLLEIMPAPEVQFSFDVNPSPRYYEFDWNITPKVQLRLGKIWVPFDNMHPHNNFGGIMNTSAMMPPGAVAFLPDIWAELGMGLKVTLADTPSFASEFHIYVTNGFQDGGTDPQGSALAYPNFGTVAALDNNDDKAIGARFKTTVGRRVSLGFSGYTCRYTSRGVDPARFSAVGADLQLQPSNLTELRAGYTLQFVGLVPGYADQSFNRGGLYAIASQKLAERFKLTGSGGIIQPDNRVVDASDRILVGGILGYTPLPYFEAAFNYTRDMNRVAQKTTYDYFALRFSVLL